MKIENVTVYYDIRNSRELPCIPVIEVKGARFVGDAMRYNVAKELCSQLINQNIDVQEIVGKFEFERTE